MKEYITKDRAKQFVCGHCNEVCSEEPCEPSDCDWMAFIDKEPAADVAPVRHGEWWHLGGDEWCCTNCGNVIHTEGSWERPEKKYCDECGAKMMKEEANE